MNGQPAMADPAPAAPRAPLAIVTMVYNEPQFLPLWLRHYTAEVQARHCYVIDHGSDDGCTDPARLPAGLNLLRIPRSPQDDARRCRFMSQFCAALLVWYESVIYVDVDEILVADPGLHASLADYAASLDRDAVISAIGLDVVHSPEDEPELDWERPVSQQRHWVRFSSSMCKPVLIRRPVSWAPGFHNIDAPPRFDELFLFHLRYADLQSGLARLARTRTQAWVSATAGSHQRMADTTWRDMLLGMAALPRQAPNSLGLDDPSLHAWLARVVQSADSRQSELYRIDLHLSGDVLWRLPERFVGRL
jgi:glycosyl transferase family 2